MKFRHTQQKHDSNTRSDYLFKDDFQDDEVRFRSPSASTPTIDKYYQKIQAEKAIPTVTSSLSIFDRIAIAITIVLMIFWSIIILSLTLALRDSNIFLGVLLGLLAYWAITWIVYYVGWKFYWIMIAIGWMLATGYALTIYGVIQQSFYRLLQ